MSEFNIVSLATGAQEEAARQMSICNACRYCEGLCAVFPAMEKRRSFGGADVDYLANLCHNCGACYQACQYAPPHEFAINVPVAMDALREESYARHTWPQAAGALFRHHALWFGFIGAAAIAGFIAGLAELAAPGAFWKTSTGAGAFYNLLPHDVLAGLFGLVFLYALLAMAMSLRQFWQASRQIDDLAPGALGEALWNAATLRYLDGGGPGCMNDDERPRDRRRLYHHLTSYGFLCCLASTSLATVCHYLGFEAPYPLWHPVVVLGTLGGLGLVAGPIGLLAARIRRAPELRNPESTSLGLVFIGLLLATSLSGLILLALRATPAMNLALAIHLGIVLALFLSLPYGKFMHGLYRGVALLRHSHEQRSE